MDFSKLPKLSDTQSQVPPPIAAQTPANPQPTYHAAPRRPGMGVDIWISLIVGILLLMMGRTFGDFLVAKIRHQPFPTGVFWKDDSPKAGQEVEYFDLEGFTALSDMSIFLFGAMLLFEALAKAIAALLAPGTISIGFLAIALLLTIITTIINIDACIRLFGFGITPITSGLAVAFGGWILFDEWQTMQQLRSYSKVISPHS